MKDDFIYKALPKVRKDFAHSLYARISTRTAETPQKRRIFPRFTGFRRAHIAILGLGIFLLVAWSQIRFLVRYVPVGELWIVEYNRTTENAPDKPFATPVVPTPWPTHRPFNPTEMSQEEMQEFVGIGVPLNLSPTWTPEGFQTIEPSHDWVSGASILRMWSNHASEEIRLSIVSLSGGMRPYAPLGMWKQVRVNGEPAILIYGRLALTSPENPRVQREWDKTLGLQLHWNVGKYVYTLETFGSYVSEEDLIRMAESMKEAPQFIGSPTP